MTSATRFMRGQRLLPGLLTGIPFFGGALGHAVGSPTIFRHLVDGGGHLFDDGGGSTTTFCSSWELPATWSMETVICSMVDEVSVTEEARSSVFLATFSMETVICSMVAEVSVTDEAMTSALLATCSLEAPSS